MKSYLGALALGLVVGFAPQAFAQHNTCYDTTRLMKSACRADSVDDYFESLARCINSSEVSECRGEARDGFRENRAECGDAAEARDDLCDRLPDTGPYIADLDPNDFNGVNGVCDQPGGQNRFFPLVPGTVLTYVNEEEEEEETIIVQILDETREIEGIHATIVRDTVYEGLPDENGEPDGDRIEDTDDYYVVDKDCNVWYMGEVAQNFEDGFLTDLDGSFLHGVEGAQAGIIMLADPQVGDIYRQEYALGDAEDAAEVLDTAADVIEDGEVFELDVEGEDINCNGACLKTSDFVGNELDSEELKFHVAGVGVVVEQDPDGEVVLKLIKIERPAP